jgi:hypothetical protein
MRPNLPTTKVWTAQQWAARMAQCSPPSADDVTILKDGRRLDSREKVLAHIAEVNQEQASERVAPALVSRAAAQRESASSHGNSVRSGKLTPWSVSLASWTFATWVVECCASCSQMASSANWTSKEH